MVLRFAVAKLGAAAGARDGKLFVSCVRVYVAARALRYAISAAICDKSQSLSGSWGLLVSYRPLASGRPGVITSVPAAQRTLDFPISGGARRPFLASLASLHWPGLAGFLYALVAPAPLWAHSVGGTIVQLGFPATA